MTRHRLLVALAFAAVTMGGFSRPASPTLQAQGLATTQKLDAALLSRLAQVAPATPLEVVIVFTNIEDAASVRALSTRFHQMQVLPMAGAILTAAQIRTIAEWPGVYSITLNAPLQYFLAESIPLVQADTVWSTYGQTGGNTTVAVIDSGIDAVHRDLAFGSKVIQNVKILPFQLSQENLPITDTSSGHGTHVSSTIGGTGVASNGRYRGVAPDVKLVGLGSGDAHAILTATQAYDWVLQHHAEYGIRVVNNSWGSTGGEISLRNPIVIATLAAYKKGILSVFAAGNDGGYDVMNPYSLAPWVLSVAAGKKDRTLADFSSRGLDGDYFKHPDLTAPGVGIVAARQTLAGYASTPSIFPNPVNPLWTASYVAMSGTSMATPHVAGAAALLFSSNPQLSPDQVITLLTSTVTPMPGYALHEAGRGYMNVRAAFEASRSLEGNLDAFLAGQQEHSETEVVGFDPNVPAVYDEYLFSGLTPVGVTGMDPIDHPFQVPDGTLYVETRVTWTPDVEDAFDMEIIDPQGHVVVSSGNGLEEGEAALFVPDAPGGYILRLHPFAAVATQYQARVKVAYGAPPTGWPPSTPPAHQVYVGVDGLYKAYGAVGLISENFRSGDTGFLVFNARYGDGTSIPDAAARLRVVFTDRHGQIVAVDDDITLRGDGGLQANIDTGTAGWTPGRITVSFAWNGPESIRALTTGFTLNNLATTLRTNKPSYLPGETIAFQGTAALRNTVAAGDADIAPPLGATITLRLLDAAGNRLASTQALTDRDGRYSGTIVAPAISRGQTTLVAESAYHDETIVVGTKTWYGTTKTTLTFPGNAEPSVSLSVTPSNNPRVQSAEATITDADGQSDVTTIDVTLVTASDKLAGRWSKADMSGVDGNTWMWRNVVLLQGTGPWTLSVTARDTAGHVTTAKKTIQ